MKFLFTVAMAVSLVGFSVSAEAAPKKKAPAKTTKTPAKEAAPAKAPAPEPKAEEPKPVETKPAETKPAETKESAATSAQETRSTSTSSAKAPMRFGLGLGTNLGVVPVAGGGGVAAIRARAEVTPQIVGNFDLGFRSESGDFNDVSGVGVSVSGEYRVFTNEAKDLNFHVLGGLSVAHVSATIATSATTSTDVSANDIALFAGMGAEYFFGGTNQFSMQVDVGPTIHLLSLSPDVGKDKSGTVISLADNLSSGILFTYYFDTKKKP
jgi:hypothetical protein